MMRRILFIILTFLCISINTYGNSKWTPIIESIIYVESKGNPNAISKCGNCVGAMQIKKIVVDDCNEYLKLKGSKKRFTYQDRYDVNKSKEMFLLIQERYNKTNNIEKGIKIWNGGCGYHKSQKLITQSNNYYKKVMNHLNNKSVKN